MPAFQFLLPHPLPLSSRFSVSPLPGLHPALYLSSNVEISYAIHIVSEVPLMERETGLQCHSQSCWIGNQKIQRAAIRTHISQLSSSNPDRGILFYLPLDSDYSCAITVDIVPIMHCCINSSAERLP